MKERLLLLFVTLLASAGLSASESVVLSTGATLEIFQADAEKANGCAIIACPGGGYAYRADEKEGSDWAAFMNDRGYTLAVLKYRLPGGNHAWPLADGRAALKYMRDNASTLNIDPTHVGVMGFSAGGHLASTIATHTSGTERPAFQILFYPVITMEAGKTHQGSIDELLGSNPSDELVQEYSNQLHVDASAPIAYITYSDNDGTVPPLTNGKVYYDALVAQSVPVMLKTYSTGGHGWSPGDKLGETLKAEMQSHFSSWLEELVARLGTPTIPEGTVITNANINFSNAITDGVVAGETNSMAVGAGEISDGWLKLYDGSSTVTIPVDQRAGTRDVVTISFKMAWGNKNNMGSGFRIKDSGGTNIGSFQFARWDGSGNNSNTFGIDNIYSYMGSHYGNAPIRDRYTQFVITVDYATGKITTNVSCTNPSAGKVFEVALANLNSVASIEFYGYGVGGNQDRASVIDDVKVTTTIGDYSVTLYNYTINYKDGDEIVKTVSGTTVAGDEISLDTYLWKDAVKYKKAEGEPEALTVQAGENILDVAVVEAPLFSYQVKSSEDFVLVSGSYYEQESVTVAYNAFYLVGTDLYAVNKTGGQYRTTFTLDSDNKEVVISATKRAGNVWYLSEGEDVPGATATSAGNNMVIRSSNAQCGYAASDLSLVKLPAGSYTATSVLYANNSGGTTVKFRYDSDYDDVVTGASNWMEKTHDFTLTEPTEILWLASGDSKNGLDLLYISNTTSSFPVTIGAAGWATLFTPYALDFTGVTGLTAYTASVEGSIVTLTAVDNVPANTGVVLRGDAGSFNIPVVAGSETLKGDLTGNTVEATAFDAESGYTYYGLGTAGNDVQFRPVTSGAIAAGKAFLRVADGADVKAVFSVVFEDATGIKAIAKGKSPLDNVELFNLAGQRVSKAQQGVYIHNGHKVLVK